MKYWKWSEVKQKIENDMDLQEDPDILADGEMMGYVNEAVDVCEQHFIGLGDYFLATEEIAITAGTASYDLPDDIYATKIRKLIYDNEYEVTPLKDLRLPSYYAQSGIVTDDFRYLIINNPGAHPQIRLFPTPTEAGTLSIFYTRNAYRLTEDGGDDQEIDVPEAMNYIFRYVKMKIYEKERSPLFQFAREDLQKYEQLMVNALAQRIDDENNEIEPEIGVYRDHY